MYTVKFDLNKDEYENFAGKNGYFLQAWDWAAVKDEWNHLYVGAYDENGQLAATALVLIKPLPMGYSMYYIPYGPVGCDLQAHKALLAELKQYGRKHKAVFIKFAPDTLRREWVLAEEERPEAAGQDVVDFYVNECGATHLGYTENISDTIQPRITMGVELKDDFEEHFTKSRKADLRKLKKYYPSLEIYTGETITPEALDAFANLVHQTEDKKNIRLRDEDYFAKILHAMEGGRLYLEKVDLGRAKKEADTKVNDLQTRYDKLADTSKKKKSLENQLKEAKAWQDKVSALVEKYGENPYASGILAIEYNRKSNLLYMGNMQEISPSAYLYTEIFRDAKERGCTFADMLGIEGTLDGGLTRHKTGYGSKVQEYIGEFDIPVSTAMYKVLMPVYNYKKHHVE